jgi:hypothetical protein
VAAFLRIGWPLSIGTGGRLPSESVAALPRIPQKLHETPMLLKLPSGYVQQNPWLTSANKQLELMHKYLSEFGLSPVSRSRVSLATHGTKSKFAGLLGVQRPWIPADEFLSPR